MCDFVSKPEIQHHGVFEGFWKQGIFGLRKSLCQNPGSDGWYTDQEHGQWAPDARQLRDPGRAQPKYSARKGMKVSVISTSSQPIHLKITKNHFKDHPHSTYEAMGEGVGQSGSKSC